MFSKRTFSFPLPLKRVTKVSELPLVGKDLFFDSRPPGTDCGAGEGTATHAAVCGGLKPPRCAVCSYAGKSEME